MVKTALKIWKYLPHAIFWDTPTKPVWCYQSESICLQAITLGAFFSAWWHSQVRSTRYESTMTSSLDLPEVKHRWTSAQASPIRPRKQRITRRSAGGQDRHTQPHNWI